MKNKLKTVKNFASTKGVTTACVYKWIEKGKVKHKKIDGVTFIIIENE
jgi:hypothetical protein